MTQGDKDLLLKDLCARLAYRVKFEYGNIEDSIDKLYDIGYGGEDLKIPVFNHCYGIDEIKPYLRPLSSMTKEEYEEYYNISYGINNIGSKYKYYDLCDWFNKHHFDYRELIEKGLALEALEGMYK